MRRSKVTDYMVEYIDKNYIETARLAQETGIPEEKMKAGYDEPLFAEEFLELCFRLKIRPEDVQAAIENGIA